MCYLCVVGPSWRVLSFAGLWQKGAEIAGFPLVPSECVCCRRCRATGEISELAWWCRRAADVESVDRPRRLRAPDVVASVDSGSASSSPEGSHCCHQFPWLEVNLDWLTNRTPMTVHWPPHPSVRLRIGPRWRKTAKVLLILNWPSLERQNERNSRN